MAAAVANAGGLGILTFLRRNASEVDIIAAQGWESVGHVPGDVATMALLPRIVVAGQFR